LAPDAPGNQIDLAVIGGSGFYAMEGLSSVQTIEVETPFGSPSDAIHAGKLGDSTVAFLARHGKGHTLLPSEVPNRANLWALASLGARMVLSVSAVGSLQRHIAPGEFVLPDQLFDRTRGARPSTFFGDGIVAHVTLHDPFCGQLRSCVHQALATGDARVHGAGTLCVIEGPAFSTRAESLQYQSWGADIIGMTTLPEAKLAREAGMCYATLACVTDYDTWLPEKGHVSVELVLRTLQANAQAAKDAIARLAGMLPDWRTCDCCSSLSQAIVTDLAIVPAQRKRDLAPILERYGAH
jgi:5'-methylthioadenosine phosphorylase